MQKSKALELAQAANVASDIAPKRAMLLIIKVFFMSLGLTGFQSGFTVELYKYTNFPLIAIKWCKLFCYFSLFSAIFTRN